MNTSSPTVSLLAAAAEGGGVSLHRLAWLGHNHLHTVLGMFPSGKKQLQKQSQCMHKIPGLAGGCGCKVQACPTSTEVISKSQLSLAPQHVLDCLSALLVLQISAPQHVLPAALPLSLGCSSLGRWGTAPCHPAACLHATPSAALFLLPPTPHPFVQAKPQTA